MVKFLAHCWAAAAGLFADWLVRRTQNVNSISDFQGRAEGRSSLLQVSSAQCGWERQVCLFVDTIQTKIFPLTPWRKSFWKEFTATSHRLISKFLVSPVPRGANHLLGYIKLLMSMRVCSSAAETFSISCSLALNTQRRKKKKIKLK